MPKNICIVTCNRAEYNKLEPIINYIDISPDYNLFLIVCGSHLIHDFGMHVDFINYPIYSKVNTLCYGSNSKIMAESVGLSMLKFPQIFSEINPDAIILHGDRFDIISVALVASLMNICIIHIEGGELSGTIDEHLRHAISKLSTYHLVSNEQSKGILIQMGENKNDIYTLGCPLYDKIINIKKDKKHLKNINGSDFCVTENDYIIAIYHSVTTNIEKCIENYVIYIETLIKIKKKILFFYPNIDNGSKKMIKITNNLIGKNNFFLTIKTLEFDKYISLLNYSACIVGNSSSGIREACVLGIPAISIGYRQNNRVISNNTIILEELTEKSFEISLNTIYGKRFEKDYLYGNGDFLKKFKLFLDKIEYKYKEKKFNILENIKYTYKEKEFNKIKNN